MKYGIRGALLTLSFFSVLVPICTFGLEIETGNAHEARVFVGDDMYSAGGTVSTIETIPGDLIVAGAHVIVGGAVGEDVIAAGGSIVMDAQVGDDVRIAGGVIALSGSVGESAILTGGRTDVHASIGGDVVWSGGTLILDAPVLGKVLANGGEVIVRAPVSGDIEFRGGKITLENGAFVGGNIIAESRESVSMGDDSSVKGEIRHTFVHRSESDSNFGGGDLWDVSGAFLGFGMILVGAFVIGLLFKGYMISISRQILEAPVVSLGWGFLLGALFLVVSIVLLATVLAFPLAALFMFAVLGMIGFTLLATPVIAGTLVYRAIKKNSDYRVFWGSILLGVCVCVLVKYIPILGGFAYFIFWLAVFGAMGQTIRKCIMAQVQK